jgi:hypothetical protein
MPSEPIPPSVDDLIAGLDARESIDHGLPADATVRAMMQAPMVERVRRTSLSVRFLQWVWGRGLPVVVLPPGTKIGY